MSKATALAYANIAVVKYWGKGDEKLRLPVNSSAAIALDAIYTTTTVEFAEKYTKDEVEIDGEQFSDHETQRVSEHLDLIRDMAGKKMFARVKTKNNFPKAVGAASSASGFAALSVAAAAALDLQLSEKELSILARQGSGSASRSIPGGVSVWHRGVSSETSYAERIDYPSDWNFKVLLVFVGEIAQKKVSSTEGMKKASTSPFFKEAVSQAEKNIGRVKQAFTDKSWEDFGKVIEDECYRLHTLCMTSTPNILYWQGATVDIFQMLYRLREQGIHAYFTVDAGPHAHIVCKEKDVVQIKEELQKMSSVQNIVECGVGKAAHLLSEHLF